MQALQSRLQGNRQKACFRRKIFLEHKPDSEGNFWGKWDEKRRFFSNGNPGYVDVRDLNRNIIAAAILREKYLEK